MCAFERGNAEKTVKEGGTEKGKAFRDDSLCKK